MGGVPRCSKKVEEEVEGPAVTQKEEKGEGV